MTMLTSSGVCLSLAFVLQSSAAPAFFGGSSDVRQLSNMQITGYEPGSDVVQHSKIDHDQKEMEAHLGATPVAFDKASKIYNLGGNSGGYATLTITALAAAVTKGTVVTQGGTTAVG